MTGFNAPVPEHDPRRRGWIGVDLDGTLAEAQEGQYGPIGAPVPAMVAFVKRLLAAGWEVRIFTARCVGETSEIANWCVQNIGRALIVTNHKDSRCFRIYDDRARQVVHNSGEIVELETLLAVVNFCKQELEALARANAAETPRRVVYFCAYCGKKFDANEQNARQQADEHARTCEKHPVRALEAEVASLRQCAEKAEQLLALYRDKRNVDGGGKLELPTGQTSKSRTYDSHLHREADVAIEMAEMQIALEQQGIVSAQHLPCSPADGMF